jgi:predicted pyridoxine 5'-phosphate oxidase superfamily flavin-nucleotide-binding protein
MTKPPSDIAFSPAVKAVQVARGSRRIYARAEQPGNEWPTTIDDALADFIAHTTTCFFATASADGQPYIQHRGGPRGFLRVLDEHRIAWADFRGNRQYVSTGNLAENPRACLFLIDYAHRARIKVWGTARVIEDAAFAASLAVPGYPGKVEHAIELTVSAWDANCPQHIPQLVDANDVAAIIAERDRRIATLEAEVSSLRSRRS